MISMIYRFVIKGLYDLDGIFSNAPRLSIKKHGQIYAMSENPTGELLV